MADLSDFGGGSSQEPTPEDQAKIDLSRWFKNHGAEVFWEKRPSYGHRVFRTQTTERPDLLAVGDRHTYAVEVKSLRPGSENGAGAVYSGAVQTHRYWRRFCIDDIDEYYRADGAEHTPDAFVLATDYAPDGRLLQRYDTQSEIRPVPIHDDKRQAWADPPVHWLPDWEFGVAETITRMLWRLGDDSNDTQETDAGAGIGSLLSTRLDGGQPTIPSDTEVDPFEQEPLPEPRALFKSFDDEGGGGVACQNWEAL